MKIRILKKCTVKGAKCKNGDEPEIDPLIGENLISLGYAEAWTNKPSKKKDGDRDSK